MTCKLVGGLSTTIWGIYDTIQKETDSKTRTWCSTALEDANYIKTFHVRVCARDRPLRSDDSEPPITLPHSTADESPADPSDTYRKNNQENMIKLANERTRAPPCVILYPIFCRTCGRSAPTRRITLGLRTTYRDGMAPTNQRYERPDKSASFSLARK